MRTVPGCINSFSKTGHLTCIAGQFFLCFTKFIFQRFYNILHQNAGGMFGVIYAHSLCTGLGLEQRGVRATLLDERSRGKAVLLVSLELDEVLQLSDRILAINQGRLIGEVSQAEATESIVGHMMAGMEREAI